MDKIYQQCVIDKTEELLEILKSISFFDDYEIENTNFARKYFLDILTEKFISGKFDDEDILSEDEFETCLKEIIAGSVLYDLKEKGFVNSYEDDEVDEVFFLTEEGKQYLKKLQDDNLI